MKDLRYNLKPSKPDSRDFAYVQEQTAIRSSVDLREWASPIEDQSRLGSCVSNAITNAYELEVKRLYPEHFSELSRLFIYYNARLFENTVKEDSGVYIRDGLKAVKMYGVCTESLWPYNIDKFDVQPSNECYAEAAGRTIIRYNSIATLRDMLETLSANKPVIIGMGVYRSFDLVDKENNVVPLPTSTDEYLGGHAVTVEGYNLDKKQFLIKNSYGTDWGDEGYGWLPFEYLRTEGFEKWKFDISNQVLALAPALVEPVITPAVEEIIIETVIEETVVEPVIEETVVEPVIVEPVIVEPTIEAVVVKLIASPTKLYKQIVNRFAVFGGPNGIGLKRLESSVA